jgi:large subunit ribosomal protein L25
MTEKINLNASTRSVVGKKVKRSRVQGLLPAVVYGHGLDSTPIFINAKEYKKAYQQAGTSTLVDLAIDDKQPVKVLLHTPEYHHLLNEPLHADLYAVNMSEKIETEIPIHFIGESLAATELEGNFISNVDELTVRCLPSDLISAVEVDISALKTFEDQIHVSDIKVPETIEVLNDPEEVVALVTPPRSEEELEAELAEDKAAEEAAVEELGKEAPMEDGEASEGQEPAASEQAPDNSESQPS